jgi:hypothetical protein
MYIRLVAWGCRMARFRDLCGQKIGRLTVVSMVPPNPENKNRRCYACLCDCGVETIIRADSLLHAATRSCGCISKEVASALGKSRGAFNLVHGMTDSRAFRSWMAMRRRVLDPKHMHYGCYGGRGISICDRWLEPNGIGFLNFFTDMGAPPPRYTLDRIDNNGGYYPENCRWATVSDQVRNQRKVPVLQAALDKALATIQHLEKENLELKQLLDNQCDRELSNQTFKSSDNGSSNVYHQG